MQSQMKTGDPLFNRFLQLCLCLLKLYKLVSLRERMLFSRQLGLNGKGKRENKMTFKNINLF